MIVVMFFGFGVLCAFLGIMWGQRHPKLFTIVRPATEDSARLDFFEKHNATLCQSLGYWCVSSKGVSLAATPDLRGSIDHAIKRVDEGALK